MSIKLCFIPMDCFWTTPIYETTPVEMKKYPAVNDTKKKNLVVAGIPRDCTRSTINESSV